MLRHFVFAAFWSERGELEDFDCPFELKAGLKQWQKCGRCSFAVEVAGAGYNGMHDVEKNEFEVSIGEIARFVLLKVTISIGACPSSLSKQPSQLRHER